MDDGNGNGWKWMMEMEKDFCFKLCSPNSVDL